jgi:hypothetical protein
MNNETQCVQLLRSPDEANVALALEIAKGMIKLKINL